MRVLAVSPHLDDAAFSAGATLASLAAAGHEVRVLTCFTASVPDPAGFALACQLDKGVAAGVDYLALRRAEDTAAMAVLGTTPVHLGLPEAPHRGYTSAADLFAGVKEGDDVWRSLTAALAGYDAALWLAPQGLGGHVDHQQVLRAVAALDRPVLWWRDSPYTLRDPAAAPGPDLPAGLTEVRLPQDLDRRADACACYRTQLGFQFGGLQAMRAMLAGRLEVLLADDRARAVLGRYEHVLVNPAQPPSAVHHRPRVMAPTAVNSARTGDRNKPPPVRNPTDEPAPHARSIPMSDTARTQAFADALYQLEQGDAEALLARFAAGAELVRPEQDRSAAAQDAETFWNQYQGQFNEISTEFDRIVEEGDEGILEWRSRGILRSGQPIEYAGVSLVTYTEDKVSRFATYYDTAAFLSPRD